MFYIKNNYGKEYHTLNGEVLKIRRGQGEIYIETDGLAILNDSDLDKLITDLQQLKETKIYNEQTE